MGRLATIICMLALLVCGFGANALAADDESIPVRWPNMSIEDRVNYALGARDALFIVCTKDAQDPDQINACLDRYGFYEKDAVPALLAVFHKAYIERDWPDAKEIYLLQVWADRNKQDMLKHYNRLKRGLQKLKNK